MNNKEYLQSFRKDDYQRDNYDKFLKKIGFSFNLPSIHIAGSNGKGQTATFIASIYESAGYKVGLYMSPYFKSPTELIRINGKSISEDELSLFIKKYDKYFHKYSLSEFEILTFIAFTYFKEEEVDVAIIECGMGGLLDATNIFTPLLSIITSISMEHTSYLGTSLSEIAMHKAGIIKEEVPVLTCDLEEDAINVISLTAKENQSDIHVIGVPLYPTLDESGYKFSYGTLKDLKINVKSLASIKDACFAIEAVQILNEKLPVDIEHIYKGLESASIECRMTIINEKSTTVVIDGSHNPEAISLLVDDMARIYDGRPVQIVFSCFRDKNIENMLTKLGLISSNVVLTTFPHNRARTEEEYFLYAEDYKYVDDYNIAIQEALNNEPKSIVLICGSLAFASLVLENFKNNVYEFKDEKVITEE